MQIIWKCPCPMKMKHFIWLAMIVRIQSAEQLKTKGWEGSYICQLYNEIETTRHILFGCAAYGFLSVVCV
jgi:hypothetical protein